jgi:cell division septation protein DedD
MTKRLKGIVTAVAAIAAVATGGAVFAQAQNGASTTPADHPTQQQDENGKDHATEGPEKAETNEKAESPENAGEAGSEVPDDDGPGGHADEPGNPNADHQFEGQE